MAQHSIDIVVAGHICLDVLPHFLPAGGETSLRLEPGTLIQVGPVRQSTGGVVANTGLALTRLGVATGLVGRIGDDLFGREILRLLNQQDPRLSQGMVVCPDEVTSYTVVIAPPGVDRMFLHCPGANHSFASDDLDAEKWAAHGAQLVHFGYPPLMRQMYLQGGAELATLLSQVKASGMATSLDMSSVDPASEAGRVDWRTLLTNALPHVDVFLPSAEELLFMLDRAAFEQLVKERGGVEMARDFSGLLLSDLADQLLKMGVAIVVIKLGEEGLYVRTTDDPDRWSRMGRCAPADTRSWTACEFVRPCFEVQVVGTTGAGDCTIAGFLMGLLWGWTPEQAARAAVAVGGASVESSDAVSAVPAWSELKRRLEGGWPTRQVRLPLLGWREGEGVVWGPRHHGADAR